eukprot:10964448-Alexandrium_andersonii.AAC.1
MSSPAGWGMSMPWTYSLLALSASPCRARTIRGAIALLASSPARGRQGRPSGVCGSTCDGSAQRSSSARTWS